VECFSVSLRSVSLGAQFVACCGVSHRIIGSAVNVAVKIQTPKTESIARAASSLIEGITWL
jgi:hypothetical protein